MNLALRIKPVKRTLVVAVIIVSLAAAVAFAILQTRGVLTGNTISTSNTNLLISIDGHHYTTSLPGFSFNNILPGGQPAPVTGHDVYLRNIGTTTLDLRLALDGAPSNSSSADLSKFKLVLTEGGVNIPTQFTLSSLFDSGQALETELAPGATRQYTLQALADEDVSQGVSIGNINLVFAGTPQDPNNSN